VFHVLAALSQFERDLTTERINAGLEEAKARGQHLGRPAAMTPAKRRAVADMLARGESRAEIARTVGVSRATLYRFLAERSATG
jgi:DNA invertase Pin-like site-specific DNA recombinase